MPLLTFALATGLFVSASACAQTPSKPQVRQTAAVSQPTQPITVGDVIRLERAGVSDEIILEQIHARQPSFELTVNQLVALKVRGRERRRDSRDDEAG